MKNYRFNPTSLACLILFTLVGDSVLGQGTAFTYQGHLTDSGQGATGLYDFRLALFNDSTAGSQVGPGVLITAVPVTNGLFTITADFGPGIFTGSNYWLEIRARTNGPSIPTLLSPRQPLSPAPYAIFAETSANLSAPIGNSQLANSGITVTAGPGLGGGGAVSLGGSTMLYNSGVISVVGNSDITALTAGGVVTLGDTATSANTPNTIVKRDANGNFSAGSLSVSNLNLPLTTTNGGMITLGGTPFLHAYGTANLFGGASAGNFTMTGGGNTGLGVSALPSETSGDYNTALGYETLYSNTNGTRNTAIGVAALFYNLGGNNNTACGFEALAYNTNGFENTANGYAALYANTSGSYNTANGAFALEQNLNGLNNAANGAFALQQNLTGGYNTANGAFALQQNLTGSYNTANGAYSLAANTNGGNNTANGYSALRFNASGSGNTADGAYAMYANSVGNNNTALGVDALYANTNGQGNTAEGFYALQANLNGSYNTANGTEALYYNTVGGQNTANGAFALYNNTNGQFNTANGYDALYYNSSGNDNTANGANALFSNLSGYNNTANGYDALFANTNGFANTADGYQALYLNASGAYNTAVGGESMVNNISGYQNTAVGYDALYGNTNGFFNSAVGLQAMFSNKSGYQNVAMGYTALNNNVTGFGNIALGYQGGMNITGNNNIDIGNLGSAGESSTIRIGTGGTQTATFIAGIYGFTSSGGTPVYINSNGQLGTTTSSRRYKQDINAMADSSDVLYDLQPVTFKYKPEIDAKGIPQFGLIAEDVDKVNPDLVVHDDQHGIYTVRYEAVNAMLLNEFLKEHRKVQSQEEEIQKLKNEIATQKELASRTDERFKALEAAVKELSKGQPPTR